MQQIPNPSVFVVEPLTGVVEEDPEATKAELSEAERSQPQAEEGEGKEDSDTQANGSTESSAAPDSPSKQLPDQISFFSGNPSVEIVHGIMHLYKTK